MTHERTANLCPLCEGAARRALRALASLCRARELELRGA